MENKKKNKDQELENSKSSEDSKEQLNKKIEQSVSSITKEIEEHNNRKHIFKNFWVWISLLLLAGIIIIIGFNYIFSGNKKDRPIDLVKTEEPVPAYEEAINEPIIEPIEEPKEILNIFSLSQIIEYFDIKTNPDWSKVLPMIVNDSSYLIYEEGEGWKVALSEINEKNIKNIIDNYPIKIRNNYRLLIKDLPFNEVFQVNQLLNRVKSLGYSAYKYNQKTNNIDYAINVGPFRTFKLAEQAGEKIYFYYKTAGLFPANFSVNKFKITNSTKPTDYITVKLTTTDSIEKAQNITDELKLYLNNFIYIYKPTSDKYEINIGFIKNIQEASQLLDNIKDDYPQAYIVKS